MPKFRIEYAHTVKQIWEVDVEADTAEEAVDLVTEGEHDFIDETLTSEDGLCIEDVRCLGTVEDGELIEEEVENDVDDDNTQGDIF